MFSSKKCQRCEGKLKEEYSFCPYCKLDLRNPESDMRDFGMLGKNDSVLGAPLLGGGAVDMNNSVMGAIFNNVMKMMEGQLKNLDGGKIDFGNMDLGNSKPEISMLPNGIQIKIGPHMHNHAKLQEVKPRIISDDQRERMTKLPRS